MHNNGCKIALYVSSIKLSCLHNVKMWEKIKIFGLICVHHIHTNSQKINTGKFRFHRSLNKLLYRPIVHVETYNDFSLMILIQWRTAVDNRLWIP